MYNGTILGRITIRVWGEGFVMRWRGLLSCNYKQMAWRNPEFYLQANGLGTRGLWGLFETETDDSFQACYHQVQGYWLLVCRL